MRSSKGGKFNRRYFLIGGIVMLFPLLKFIGFNVPRKPVHISIHKPVPSSSGVFLSKDFILFDRGDTPRALSRTCTHLGCRLNYLADKDILECPCHNSQFNAATGEVIRGPAKKPLTSYPVKKRDSEPYYVVTI